MLGPSGDFTPAWSPNGSEIAISRSQLDPSGRDIHLIDLLGNSVQLTNGLDARSPSWSPDGLRIAFSGGGLNEVPSLYVVGRDGSGPTELLASPGGTRGGIAWSPDGAKIAFEKRSDPNGEIHISVFDIATSVVTRLTQPGSSNLNPSWSPDSSQATFQSDRQ